jgi:hypothetical protein
MTGELTWDSFASECHSFRFGFIESLLGFALFLPCLEPGACSFALFVFYGWRLGRFGCSGSGGLWPIALASAVIPAIVTSISTVPIRVPSPVISVPIITVSFAASIPVSVSISFPVSIPVVPFPISVLVAPRWSVAGPLSAAPSRRR